MDIIIQPHSVQNKNTFKSRNKSIAVEKTVKKNLEIDIFANNLENPIVMTDKDILNNIDPSKF